MRSLRAMAFLWALPSCSFTVRAGPAPDAAVDLPAPMEVERLDAPDAVDAAPPDAAPGLDRPDVALDAPDAEPSDRAVTDEAEVPASCAPGAAVSCYAGPSATAGVGRCLRGVRICGADGRWAGACLGEVVPAAGDSVCNGVDDDCNGIIDDLCEECFPGAERLCYSGRPTPPAGRCRAGRQVCSVIGLYDVPCAGEVLAAADETCGDGVDDDCDGAVDQGCGACAAAQVRPCYSGPAGSDGLGACRGGVQRCGPASAWAAGCEGEVAPVDEVCGNGVDDDCDGDVDERCARCGDEASRACYSADEATRGVGRCRGGTRPCEYMGPRLEGCDGEVTPAAEVCGNGVDDDCDGAVDECAGGAVSAALALGRHRSCVGMSDGTLRCWGRNVHGELGLGARYRHQVHPREVPGGSPRAAGGADFLCARQGDGAVRCAGRNQLGQLGDGGLVDRAVHAPVPGLADVDELVAGREFACARVAVDGSVRCWGSARFGQLGRAVEGACPVGTAAVACGTTPGPVAGLRGAVGLAAGAYHACARLADGGARCWGDNASGQLGDGTTLRRATAVVVAGVTDVVQLAAGEAHTCALRRDGAVLCWGSNAQGQLGDGTAASRATPAPVVGLRDVAQVAAGDHFTCARLNDGTLRCWGANARGQLGDGTSARRAAPTAVAGVTHAAEVAAGGEHACVRLTGGAVLCWGRNLHGQVGDGTTVDRLTPRLVAP